MNKVYKLLTSRVWDVCWLTTGILLVTLGTIFTFDGTIDVTFVTLFLGSIVLMITVLLMANQKGRIGSAFGVVGMCLDTFNNYQLGIPGNVLVSIYNCVLYIKGFFTLGKKIKVTKFSKSNMYVSGIICILGVVILYFFGSSILPENAPLWVIIFNVVVFLDQVIAQYLTISGKAAAWVCWILANAINISLQLYLVIVEGQQQALIYSAMAFMNLLNSIKALIVWCAYKEEQE